MLTTGYSTPHGHSEQLSKILAGRLNTDSDRDARLYSTPGHMVLQWDQGRELYIFASVPLSDHQKFNSSGNWGTHLEFPANPIRSVLFFDDGASTFLTVHRSGRVHQWQFDSSLRTWHKVSSLDLECGDGEVEAAVLHKGHSVLYWSQRTMSETTGNPKYTICTAGINTDREEELTLRSRHPVLTDCPPCSLHTAGDSLLVWFKDPAPPGVYVTWRPVNRTLSMSVHGNGVVTKRQVYTHAVSFHQMALQTSALWAQSTPTTDWTLVEHGIHGAVRFVAQDGSLWRVSNDCLLVRGCCLQQWAELLSENPRCVNHPLGILTATSNSLWLHSSETGAVLGTVQPDVTVTGIWASVSTLEAGFVTPKGRLQVSLKVSHDHGDEAEEGSRWLKLLTSAPRRPNSEGHPRLQSTALHLTALHQTRDNIDLASRRQLIDHLKQEKPTRPTRLQASLEPLVCKFAELEGLQGCLFQNPQPSSILSVEQEICDLLPPDDDLSQHDTYFRVTLLSMRSAERVVAAILARTGLVPHESMPCSDAASSYLRSAHGRPVLVLATRLLFVTRPDCLVEFLNHILNSGSDDTAAFQKQTQAPVYSEVLQNLPSHRASHDNKVAVSALATILYRSRGERCEEKSLTLLIENKLWREAADLLEQLPPKSDHFVPLYWRLVMAAAQEGAFPALSDSLLAIAPPNISLVSLLHQMKTAVSAASNSAEHKSDFPIGKLIQYLNTHVDKSLPP